MQNKKIHVANLPFETTEDDLRRLFEAHGEVLNVKLIKNREDESRGFAFVIMSRDQATAAIAALDGEKIDDRRIRVSQAQPPQERQGSYIRGRGK